MATRALLVRHRRHVVAVASVTFQNEVVEVPPVREVNGVFEVDGRINKVYDSRGLQYVTLSGFRGRRAPEFERLSGIIRLTIFVDGRRRRFPVAGTVLSNGPELRIAVEQAIMTIRSGGAGERID